MAQSAVSSLLGQLSGLLVDEAKLLGGVRRDVQFIKDEMESMQGFLLDADSSSRSKSKSNQQVVAWRRQVREVAYDSQKCIDRYVQTVGASRPSAGLLGSVSGLPQMLWTMPTRHRIAKEIKELKVRSREVGERRQRYGVKAPPPAADAAPGPPALPLLPQQREAEHARKRRAIADATDWLNTDAQHVMEWIARAQEKHTTTSVFGFLKNVAHIPHFTTDNLFTELISLTGNKADAASFFKDQTVEWVKEEAHEVFWLMKEMLSSEEKDEDNGVAAAEGAPSSPSPREHDDAKQIKKKTKKKNLNLNLVTRFVRRKIKAVAVSSSSPSASGDDGANKVAAAAGLPTNKTRSKEEQEASQSQDEREAADHRILSAKWLRRVLKSDGIHILHKRDKTHGPRFLAIVAPPVDIPDLQLQDDEDPHVHRRATEIATRVYDHYTRPGSPFDFTVKVKADGHSQATSSMLRDILKQVQEQAQKKQQPLPPSDQVGATTVGVGGEGGDHEATMRHEIAKHLKGKKYLIFLADQQQDDTSWTEILTALPTDSTDESLVMLTPLVQQPYQYVGWFALSLAFLIRHSSYRVYFYSHFVATRNKVNELLQASSHGEHVSKDLQGSIDKILKTCRWDSFSTKMFLHALYANPHRSKDDLEGLHNGLSEFSMVSNAINMINFSYNDLPSHYKACFLYLSIFARDQSSIRRTRLVRRWAAEGLVVGRDGLAVTDEAERCFSELVDRGLLQPADHTENPTGKVDRHVLSFITRRTSRDDDGHAAGDNILLWPELAHRLSIPSGITQLSKKTRRASEWLMKQMDRDAERQVSSQDTVDNMVKFLSLFRTSESGWIKVLDLEGYKGLKKKHLKEICNKIFRLKYLSLRNTDIDELPKEINKLQDLETFDIRGTNIQRFPAKSIVLSRLGCLLSGHHIDKDTGEGSSHASFTAVDIPRGIGSMMNMQVLSHVKVCDGGDEAALDLARLQMLRKLGVVINGKQGSLLLKVVGMLSECLMSLSIHISDGGDVPDLSKKPPIFSPPRSLASLSISGKIGGLPTSWLHEIDQLSDITLCETSLQDTDIMALGVLINLRFIRLLRDSYIKKTLIFEKGFRSLEFLIVQGSTISDIRFKKRVAPKLEKIVWSSTCKMTNLEIDGLPSLKEIELHGDYDRDRISKSIEANSHKPVLKLMNPVIQLRSSGI